MKAIVISKTIQEFNGKRYYKCGKYFQRDGIALHRVVWTFHNGKIPKHHHIHHKDQNTSNNNLDNLEVMLNSIHLSKHASAPEREAYNLKHIEDIRILASEWHGSPDGRKWHGKHAKEMWANKQDNEYICTECGKTFKTKHDYGKENTFCSNNCKSNYRRKLGIDNETRICNYCGEKFVTNKYSKAKCCSRSCAVNNRWGR